MNREELLNVAAEAGGLLLRSGAEIYRVEESMHRIFEAYGVRDGNVFAIPSCINVTINTDGGAPLTRVMRILGRNMAFFLRCKELALQSGLSLPTPEPFQFTNFIRE